MQHNYSILQVDSVLSVCICISRSFVCFGLKEKTRFFSYFAFCTLHWIKLFIFILLFALNLLNFYLTRPGSQRCDLKRVRLLFVLFERCMVY